jgi:hypothetical protein
MRLQMINMQEFARRLSALGAAAFTSDDVVDLATAADVRISVDLEIGASVAQRLLDQISPTPPVTGAQITASQWPPLVSSRPAAPSVSFSSPGAVDGPADQPSRPRRSGPARSDRRSGLDELASKTTARSGRSCCLDGGEWPTPHGYRFGAGRTGLEAGWTASRFRRSHGAACAVRLAVWQASSADRGQKSNPRSC